MSISSIHAFDGGVIPDSETSGGSSSNANIKNLVMMDFVLNIGGETVPSKILCDYNSPQQSSPYYAPVSIEDMAQWTHDGFVMQVRLESQPSIAANLGFLARVSISHDSIEDEVTNAKVFTYERLDDHRIKFNILNFDKVTDEVTSIDYLRLSGMDEFTLDSSIDTTIAEILDKIPSTASANNKLVTEQQLENATASMASGYTPKGPASVSTLNGLTEKENGDQYIVTNSGTLTDGSLSVIAGESVAWDSVNEEWYKVNQYALKRFGTNEVKNLFTTATESDLNAGSYTVVDTLEGPKKLPGNAIAPKSVQDELVRSTLKNIGAITPTLAESAPYNDLNAFPINEVTYAISAASSIAHKPTDEAFNVLTFGGEAGAKCQIASTLSKKIFMRAYWSNSWGAWICISEIPSTLKNIGAISATIAGSAPYNDLNTFPINEVSYAVGAASSIANKPTDEAFNVLTFGGESGAKCQIASTLSKKIFMRAYWANSWGEWNYLPNKYNVVNNIGAISATLAESTPYNDLNTFPINEVAYAMSTASSIANKPTDEAFVISTIGGESGAKFQIVSTSSKKVFMRAYWSNAWSAWIRISDIPSCLKNIGAITATIAESAPYNDLNTFPINEVSYAISAASNIAHKPTNEAFNVLTFGGESGAKCQIASTLSKRIFIRAFWADAWSEWHEVSEESTVNPLLAFTNFVCIGDSLTYSQVYTSSSTSRQAYKTYPQMLATLCGTSQTTYAHAGDTTAQSWTRYNSNLEAKTNALAIIYLGTNGGLTDTLDEDAPSDSSYDTWADTNTGCYAKYVAKLQSIGYKILLIKPWATGGDLSTTHSVIDQVGNRFKVAVCGPFHSEELKYHYYPDLSGNNHLHYNDLGYSWFASKLISIVARLPSAQLKYIIPA